MSIKNEKQSVTFLAEKVDLSFIDSYAAKKQRTRSNVIACIIKEWKYREENRIGSGGGGGGSASA